MYETTDDTSDQDGTSADGQRITEQDVENFLSNEKLTDEQNQQPNNEDVDDFKPEVGMQFETETVRN